MLNKFRFVENDSNYNDNFQCLSCKRYYIGDRYDTYAYCPHCGIEFDCENVCRNHNVPRWEYNLYGNDGLPSVIRDKENEIYKRHRDSETVWVVEERFKFTFLGTEFSRWEELQSLRGKECNSKSAYGWLQFYKNQSRSEDILREIRIRSDNDKKRL